MVVVVVKVTVVIVGAVAAAKSRALARGDSPQMVPRLRSTRTLWAFPEFRTDFLLFAFCLLVFRLHCQFFDSLFFAKFFTPSIRGRVPSFVATALATLTRTPLCGLLLHFLGQRGWCVRTTIDFAEEHELLRFFFTITANEATSASSSS